jgi:Ca2+-dependent lipid-binding protein
LLLHVYDWNKIQEDECIGTAVVDLTDLEPRLSIEKSVPLAEHPQSSIVVRLNFTPGFVTFHMKRTSTLAAVGTLLNPLAGAKSVMNVGKGIGKGVTGGVTGAFGGVKSVFGGSSTKRKDEPPPPASAPVPIVATEPVEVTPSIKSETLSIPTTLATRDSAPASPTLATHDNLSSSRLSTSTGLPHYGKLVLTVVEAKDLKAVDSGGTSDPYVKVMHNKKEILKTQVVKKNLNPSWNETVSIPNVAVDGLVLLFDVKDYNRIGANVTIGEIEVNVAKHLNLETGQLSADFWTEPLNGGGQLHLKLEYHEGMTEESKRQTIFGKLTR